MFNFALIIFSWIYFIVEYSTIKDQVPIAFDFDEKPILRKSKKFLFSFPALHTTSYILLTVMSRFPEKYKYPIEITENNRQQAFLYVRYLLLYIKIITSFLFIFLTFGMISVVTEKFRSRNMYFCFFFIFFILLELWLI